MITSCPRIALFALLLTLHPAPATCVLQPEQTALFELAPDEFALRINQLSQASAADSQPRLREITLRVRDQFRALSRQADESLAERLDEADRLNTPLHPQNALRFVHQDPPVGLEVVRATLQELDSDGDLTALCVLLRDDIPPIPWTGEASAASQFTSRSRLYFAIRDVTSLLRASARAASLENDHKRALDSLSAILSLARILRDDSMCLPTLGSVVSLGHAANDLRLLALEQRLDLDLLERAEIMLAQASHDEQAWLDYATRIARSEEVFFRAMISANKDVFKSATPEDLLRCDRSMTAACERFIQHMSDPLEPALPSSKGGDATSQLPLAPDLTQSLDELATTFEGALLQTAKTLRNTRAHMAAVRHLLAIERHRVRATRLPETLDDLDPATFHAPSPDRGTLIYRPDPSTGTYILYAFGPDDEDNGGIGNATPSTPSGKDCVLTTPRESMPTNHEIGDRSAR